MKTKCDVVCVLCLPNLVKSAPCLSQSYEQPQIYTFRHRSDILSVIINIHSEPFYHFSALQKQQLGCLHVSDPCLAAT